MDNQQQHNLFTHSGCLTEEGLRLVTRGLLTGNEAAMAKSHLLSCALCAFAAEGYALADSAAFSGDVEFLNQHFNHISTATDNIIEESARPPEAVAEIPLSINGIREETDQLPMGIHETNETFHKKNDKPGKEPVHINFLKRYRVEMIAASLLLLIGIGGWIVISGIQQTRNSEKLAAHQAKPETATLNEPAAESDLVQLSSPQEIREKVNTTNRQMISVVEDNLQTGDVNNPGNRPLITVFNGAPAADTALNGPSLSVKEEARDQSFDVIDPGVAISEMSVDADTEQTVVSGATEQVRNEAMASAKSAKTAGLRQGTEEEEIAERDVFTVVEESPHYPGGDEVRMKFLQENIHYPEEARVSSIQGTVYITFVVEKNGTITDVRVLRGIGGGCDEEALRVVRLMPPWIPGKQRGKPVRVRFNLPVRFSLAG